MTTKEKIDYFITSQTEPNTVINTVVGGIMSEMVDLIVVPYGRLEIIAKGKSSGGQPNLLSTLQVNDLVRGWSVSGEYWTQAVYLGGSPDLDSSYMPQQLNQVNSDWNATTGPAMILNKPIIPPPQVNSDWNAVSGPAVILNKPLIPSTDDFATEAYVDNAVDVVDDALFAHEQNFNNPHSVTKAQVGLGFVNNTTDAEKPVSTAQAAADAATLASANAHSDALISQTITNGDTTHAPSSDAIYDALLLKLNPADLNAHIDDPTDAHDASAISFIPTGMVYTLATNVQDTIQQVDNQLIDGLFVDKTMFITKYQTGLYRIDTDTSALSNTSTTVTVTNLNNVIFRNAIQPDNPNNKRTDFTKNFGTKVWTVNATNTALPVNTRGIFYLGINIAGTLVYRNNGRVLDQDLFYVARVLVDNTAGVYSIVSAMYYPDVAKNDPTVFDRHVLATGEIRPSGAASISFKNVGITFTKASINYRNNKNDPNYLTIADSVGTTPLNYLLITPNVTSIASALVFQTTLNKTTTGLAGGPAIATLPWFTPAGVGAAMQSTHYQIYRVLLTVSGNILIQVAPNDADDQTLTGSIANDLESAKLQLSSAVFTDPLPVGDSIELGRFYMRGNAATNGSDMSDDTVFFWKASTATSSSSSSGVTSHSALSGKNDDNSFLHTTDVQQANWDTAYNDRNKWDGGLSGLIPATGRASLGGTTLGQNLFTSPNPGAVRFLRANADNSVSWLDAPTFLTAIGGAPGTVTTISTAHGSSGLAPNSSVATPTTTPVITINIPLAATASVTAGLISKAEYDIFNAKQAALNGTGFVKMNGTTVSYDATVYAPDSGVIHTSSTPETKNGNLTIVGTLTSNTFVKSGATAGNILLAGGTDIPQSTFALASGNANYIQNRTGSAQTADMWISGTGRIDGAVILGSKVTLSTQPINSGGTYSIVTINSTTGELEKIASSSAGSVSSVGALTLGTTGTAPNSTVANPTTAAVITLNIPLASAASVTAGLISKAEYDTFNGKQAQLNGTGFVKVTGTTVSYDNSTYQTVGSSFFIGTTSIANNRASAAQALTGITSIDGTAVNVTGIVSAVNGGTGQSSYAVGDLLYASTTTALSKLADVATGNVLISGGVGVAPSWGKVALTTHISGVLPVANGGTGNSATPAAGSIAYGNGASITYTAAGTAGQYLKSAGSGTPVWANITMAEITGVLDADSGGTGISAYAVGDLIQGASATTLSKLAAVATGNVLLSGGVATLSTWGKVGLTTHVSGILGYANGGTGTASVPTLGGIVYGNTSAYAITAAGASGQFLKSNAAAAPTWNTLTLTDLPGSAYKESVKAATTADLGASAATHPTITGPTGAAAVAFPNQDGVAIALNDRILVKNQTTAAQNGIYYLSTQGVAGTTAWVLTRTADSDTAAELCGGTVNVDAGTINGGSLFTTALKSTPDVVGTTNMNWYKILDESNLLGSSSTAVGAVKYNGTTSLGGCFDGGTTNPGSTQRLNYNGYFYPTYINLIASPVTATAATHYFMQQASDGFVRPKTLANVQAEIVTSASVLAATGAALTTANDTNITLTLGGTPATSLLRAASITAGWTGTLADARIASAANWNTAYTNRITSLTTTGASGAATLSANVLNIPNYTLAGLGGINFSSVVSGFVTGANSTVLNTDTLDVALEKLQGQINARTSNTGTVTSVAALTLGTSGTAPNSSVATGTTTPVITLNLPMAATASVTAGLISKTEYDTFNAKINYSSVVSGFVTGANSSVLNTDSLEVALEKLQGQVNARTSGVSGTAGTIAKFTAAGTIGNSLLTETATGVGVGKATIYSKFDVGGSLAIDSNLSDQSTRPAFSAGILANGEIRGYSQNATSVNWGFLRISAGGGVNGTERSFIDLTGSSAVPDMDRNIVMGVNGVERFRMVSGGACTFTNSVTATGFFNSSDERLKEIISRDGDTITFKWKDGRDDKQHLGYLAHEVQKTMPDSVNKDENGFLSVNYIEVLVSKISGLEKKVRELANKLNNI